MGTASVPFCRVFFLLLISLSLFSRMESTKGVCSLVFCSLVCVVFVVCSRRRSFVACDAIKTRKVKTFIHFTKQITLSVLDYSTIARLFCYPSILDYGSSDYRICFSSTFASTSTTVRSVHCTCIHVYSYIN